MEVAFLGKFGLTDEVTDVRVRFKEGGEGIGEGVPDLGVRGGEREEVREVGEAPVAGFVIRHEFWGLAGRARPFYRSQG